MEKGKAGGLNGVVGGLYGVTGGLYGVARAFKWSSW